MSNAVVPLNQLQRRAPEAGRIRLGIKTGRAMKSITEFRFTSPHRDAIEKLAELYGGEARPWDEPKANQGQWEVISHAKTIEVLIQPDGFNTQYELWSGGGRVRQCDGVTALIATKGPEASIEPTPCICNAKGERECDPISRLQVVLPNLDFYGVWRLQTKGWNAAKELPGMIDMVAELAERGRMVRANLHLEQRTSKTPQGGTKHYVVPTISIAASPNQMLEGQGVAKPQIMPRTEDDSRMLERGQDPETIEPEISDQFDDGDIVEAEVIDIMSNEVADELEAQVRTIAEGHNQDADIVVATLWEMADSNETKIRAFIKKNDEGKHLGFTRAGKLKWTS